LASEGFETCPFPEGRWPTVILKLVEIGERYHRDLPPAILNAIYDATGVRINELPVTSESD
jgi:hypothetical protein